MGFSQNGAVSVVQNLQIFGPHILLGHKHTFLGQGREVGIFLT